ncbi:MAG: exodeoxyribonuclease VII small subunit [Clostridia bacterium]|nr:exodeoxyribonuclease VII small subunit [Clostridia bacterium]
MATKKTELSFEENIKELENIVKALESGDVSLDEMLKLFEEGVKRTKECTRQLKNAEQKITVLMENPDGTMKEVPFEQN